MSSLVKLKERKTEDFFLGDGGGEVLSCNIKIVLRETEQYEDWTALEPLVTRRGEGAFKTETIIVRANVPGTEAMPRL